jgi:VWFA-related protein
MIRNSVRLVASAIVLTCLAGALPGQDNSKRITVDALLQDASGRLRTDLQQSDFEIYEDGQRRDIKSFSAVAEPRSILYVFDITGFADERSSAIVKSAGVALENVREQDRVALGTIRQSGLDTGFDLVLTFRAKPPKNSPVNVKFPGQERGENNIYAALETAAKRFGKETGRRAIVAVTSGRDRELFNETRRLGYVKDPDRDEGFNTDLKNAKKQGIPYYFVALETDPNHIAGHDYEFVFLKKSFAGRDETIAEKYLAGVRLRFEKLAEATGGQVIYAPTLNDAPAALQQIQLLLGSSYTLGYSSSASTDGRAHRLEVRVKDAILKVSQSRTTF